MSMLRRTWNLLEPHERRRYMLLSLADGAIQVLDILFLAGLLALVQRLLQPGGAASLPLAPVVSLPLLFLAFLAKNAAGFATSHALHAFGGSVALRLAVRQLEGCQLSTQQEFINTDSSVFIRKVNFHPLEFVHYLLLGYQQIAAQLLLVLLSITAVLLFDAALFALLVTVLAPPAFFLYRAIRRRIDARKDAVKHSNEDSLRYLLDALKGQPEGKVYGARDFFRARYARERQRFTAAYFEMIGLQQLPARALETVAVLGLLLLLGLSLQRGDAGNFLLLRAGTFLAAAYKVIPGLVKLIGAHGQLRAWSFTLDGLPAQPPEPQPVGRIHAIEVEALGFSYGHRRLFGGLSFSAGPGELLVLESPSGSGKTTLLQVLLGLLPAQAGVVRINGRTLEATEAAAYWPRIAYSRQQVFLLHDSIERNITLEEFPSKPLRLAQVLEATGLARMLAAEGAGSGKIVRENGGNLSGGQQQRIALARALYRQADLYLLDEPFSELDHASVAQLQQLLQEEVAAGKIVLLVTHQPETIPGARRIRLHESTPQHTGAAYARLRSVGSR